MKNTAKVQISLFFNIGIFVMYATFYFYFHKNVNVKRNEFSAILLKCMARFSNKSDSNA